MDLQRSRCAQLGFALTLAIIACRQGIAQPAKPKQEAVVQGQITDIQGMPIQGARVWFPVVYSFSRPEKRKIATATTDADGRYRMEIPNDWLQIRRQGPRVVWAAAEGHALAAMRLGALRAELPRDMQLGRATDTVFIVKDANQRAAADVFVSPWHYVIGSNLHIVPTEVRKAVAVKTDDQGRAHLASIEKSLLGRVHVEGKEVGRQIIKLQYQGRVPSERIVRLQSVGRMVLDFRCEDPDMLSDIEVFLWGNYSKPEYDKVPEGHAELVTNEWGQAIVPRVAVGNYLILPMIPPERPVRPVLPDNIEIRAGEMTRVEAELRRAVKVRGKILVQGDKTPVPNARISVRYGKQRQGDWVYSDENGEYEAFALPGRGYVQLIANPSGLPRAGPSQLPFVIPQDAKTFELPTIELKPENQAPQL